MVVLLALSSFADPGFSYLSGLICMILGILGFVWYVAERKGPIRKFLSRIDYDTTIFLIGIFIVVGAMTELGLIGMIAQKVSRLTGHSMGLAFFVIVIGSVFISAVVDNVPYLAAMLPVVARIVGEHSAVGGASADYRTLLFFGLLIGACLGGNITPVGASANIVGCGLLKKHGYHVTFWEYFRVGLPFTIAAVVPAAIFLWLIWAR
jgi:Na+/H+ antiporter NhaD/arsenite permease-like protein